MSKIKITVVDQENHGYSEMKDLNPGEALLSAHGSLFIRTLIPGKQDPAHITQYDPSDGDFWSCPSVFSGIGRRVRIKEIVVEEV